MATKKNLKDKVDKRYRAAVVVGKDGAGKEIKQWVSAKTKKELEEKKKAVLDRFVSGYDVADMTVQDYIKLWLPGRIVGLRERTVDGIVTILNVYILPSIGSRYISSIVMGDLIQITEGMVQRSLANEYICHATNEIKRIFASAHANGIIKRDPAFDLKPASSMAQRKEKRALSQSECSAILEVGKTELHGILLMLMYYLGIRLSEAGGLKWQDISWSDSTIRIARQTSQHGTETQVKTKKSNRTVPIPDALMGFLRAHRGVGYIMTMDGGGLMSTNYIKVVFDRLMEKAARIEPSCAELSSHYLRHNYASICYNAGIPAKTLQAWMGHASIATTLDIYAHLDKTKEKEAAKMLKDAF